ncbi:nuclear transport factor 2 family protein [uncultured Ferrovibrio sp.]|jgi:ketosteroid isomerase-like protein|uniref:YybH family protein n=1 Tax=uncultured Ferrovibrio sp. TaxID=1576913 RepID=UPI00260B35E0|nr:nuclear transport factor 2 family protein [uncultured Ferrovibrio sp.]
MQRAFKTNTQEPDVTTLANLAREWVEVGWRHTPEEPFNFRQRLERFYDWSSPDTQFFDDFDKERRVNKTAAQYAAIWDEVVPQMKQLTNVLVGGPRILVSGDLAIMSVQFITSYVTADGDTGQAHTLSSLVWRRSSDGWRIIREHGSGLSPQQH